MIDSFVYQSIQIFVRNVLNFFSTPVQKQFELSCNRCPVL
jgi:hypothetical protein